jgi:hypothetical protein
VRSQLLLNTKIHLLFFARNRIVLAFGLLMIAIFGLSLVPMLLYETSGDRFNLIRRMIVQVTEFCWVFVTSLGLFAISAHLRDRSVKLVITKPCLPEIWLASIFLAAILIAAAMHTLVVVGVWMMSWLWGIPWQWGFLLVAIHAACQAVIGMALLSFLSTAFHPVLAILIALFFGEASLYQLKFLVAGGMAAGTDRPGLALLEGVCEAAYMLVPMTTPFAQALEPVYMSFRTTADDWVTLLGAISYTVLVTTLLFFLSDYLLRRKTLT